MVMVHPLLEFAGERFFRTRRFQAIGKGGRKRRTTATLRLTIASDRARAAPPRRVSRMEAPLPRMKPRLRGVFHEIGFYAAVALGVPLVLTAEEGRARLAATGFANCVCACFGASPLYRRPTSAPTARRWLARLD